MNKLRQAIVLLSTAVLTACAVGPDYRQPAFPRVERFARAQATSSPEVDTEFWKTFHDAPLTALIEQALSSNNDLRAALAHYEGAWALLHKAKFDSYPIVTMHGEAGRQRLSVDQAYGFPRSNDVYNVGVDASWELDLFGRVRREVEARHADAAALAEDLKALQVSIVGQVADTYMELRGTQERLRVAHANIENQRETLRIVSARMESGRSSDFDVERARAQLESTTAKVFALQAQIAVDEHRLAVLTGRPPEALIAELDVPGPLPALPAGIDPQTPADLLRRRPDVVAAEQRLHAATARVGVATADLFPRLSFEGMLGTFAFRSGDLFKGRSDTGLAALGIDWSFLDVGRVRARIAASDADASAALAQYQQAVLLALEDAENALIRYARARSEDEHLHQAALDSAKAVRLAHERFRAGAIGVYEVLDAERTQLRAQDAFAEGRARSAVAAVALYQALAGGWPQRMPARTGLAASASVAAR